MKKAIVLSAGAVVALALASHTVSAAGRLGRVTVDIKVTGQEQWRNAPGTDTATVRIAQTVSYSTVVKTDGEIVDFNSKDPNYSQQQMAMAAQNAQAVTRARGQQPLTQAEFKDRV